MVVYYAIGIVNDNGVNCNVFTAIPMCYLPAPHNTLVINKGTELTAVSVLGRHKVWSQNCETFTPRCLLYYPPKDVLLASYRVFAQVRILNPSNGVILQTIEISNINSIDRMCLCSDQIIMLQRSEEGSDREFLSYYSLK